MTLPSERTIEKKDGTTITIRAGGNWKRPVIGVRRAAWRDWRITWNDEDVKFGARMKTQREAESWAGYMKAQAEAEAAHGEAMLRCLGLEPPTEDQA